MSRVIHKSSPVLRAKALQSGDEPGTFEAVWSVFGVVDSHRDVVAKGAFSDAFSKALPPIIWSHQWSTPPIGVTLSAEELDRDELEALGMDDLPPEVTGGTYAKARLFVNQDDGEDVPLARHVYAALTAAGGDGRAALREFSWGGTVLEETLVRKEDGSVDHWRIDKVAVDEWGPCLRGANPETELVAVKALVERGVITRAEAREALSLDLGDQASDEAAKSSLPCGGGDPQDRARIADLLLP